jgi:mannan endo-1,4-beta-mannosidase
MIPATHLTPPYPPAGSAAEPLSWIRVSPGVPYFEEESGRTWTPIGHNEALTWPHLAGVTRQPEVAAAYFRMLQAHGVTCLRLMLEYAQGNSHYFERPAGRVNPRMISVWDRLFALAERHSVRFLLTPFDTFWMWKRWTHHPYNRRNGGPGESRSTLLTSAPVRAAIKNRLAFAVDRWGGTGTVFAWDLWNEIHPAYSEEDAGHFHEVIGDLATFVRERELRRFGRAHPITVSAFGPMLAGGFRSRELGATDADPRAAEAIYRHEALDFATVHTYAHGTIDDPANTVDAAVVMGQLTRGSVLELPEGRPFFDSEHGPIHAFKDKRRVLPEAFDDEYFRHLQWAHLASGGAGGGMRWPNRSPHVLTPGMHQAQRALAGYLPLITWSRFRRKNLNDEIRVTPSLVRVFGCGDARQATLWLVRLPPRSRGATLDRSAQPATVRVDLPGLAPGDYIMTTWDTEAGREGQRVRVTARAECTSFGVTVSTDLAVAIRPAGWD